jgi:hypothetical protein
MSDILSREQRERIAQQEARRTSGADALGRLVGFVLGLVVLVLFVAGLAAVVALLWRQAVR